MVTIVWTGVGWWPNTTRISTVSLWWPRLVFEVFLYGNFPNYTMRQNQWFEMVGDWNNNLCVIWYKSPLLSHWDQVKWLPFWGQHFQMHFLQWKLLHFALHSLKNLPECLTDCKSAIFGDALAPSTSNIWTHGDLVYWRICASTGFSVLSEYKFKNGNSFNRIGVQDAYTPQEKSLRSSDTNIYTWSLV